MCVEWIDEKKQESAKYFSFSFFLSLTKKVVSACTGVYWVESASLAGESPGVSFFLSQIGARTCFVPVARENCLENTLLFSSCLPVLLTDYASLLSVCVASVSSEEAEEEAARHLAALVSAGSGAGQKGGRVMRITRETERERDLSYAR